MVIWFIGLSGSGKTTLATELFNRLKASVKNLVLLDGDALRVLWGDNPGHDMTGRYINAQRISHLTKFLSDQNIHVVAAVLSIFPQWQRWNRKHIDNYYEVFLDIPIDILKQRDTKKLYSRAEKGEINNVVGIDIDFPKPASPDLVITAEIQDKGVNSNVDMILERLNITL